MKILPITTDRVTSGLRWRVRKLGKRLAGPQPVPTLPPVEGVVEDFTAERLSGWVAVAPTAPPVRVRLLLHDHEIAAAWATTARTDRNVNGGEARRFDLRLRDLWAYVGPTDALRVQAADRTLPIVGHGSSLVPEKNGRYSPAALQKKMAGGHVFGQTGRLQLSKTKDTAWQMSVMDLYREVAGIVAEVHGYETFLFYGSLLGAVREGTVIGHDVDFDAAYLSGLTDPRAAALELRTLGLLLVDKGFHVRCAHTSLHIYSRAGSGTRIDLFHTYFDEDGAYGLPFGMAGTVQLTAAEWRGTKEVEFCGGRVQIPANSEQMAELLYGADWRSPQPGFDWARERTTRDWRGVLSVADTQEVYWADFYAHTEFSTGSTFFEHVNALSDLPETVIDLGCGDGRDSVAFGSAGRHVLGLDRSVVGVRHAVAKVGSMGLTDRVTFEVCDLGHAAELRDALTLARQRLDSGLVFYLRFLLHSVPAAVQETLMTVISELGRPGDVLAAEFRTDKDEKRSKTYGSHYRRFQNGPAYGRELEEKYGFAIIEEQEGTGLSPYKKEDPELYRVVARRV